MSTLDLPCVEIDHPDARHSIIWLHGLGDDGHGFAPIVPVLRLPADAAVRFVFPHAPMRPVTINAGYVMRAWYDILEIGDLNRRLDETNIVESVAAVHRLIQCEIDRGILANHIVLAGFSQGGLIALNAGLSFAQRLAGIVALSTYWPEAETPVLAPHPQQASLPIFCAHGDFDTVVNPNLGQAVRARLQSLGYQTTAYRYDMGHEVCQDEILDLSDWLQQHLLTEHAPSS
ncbi:carboxylesterase [Chitinivorax sp. B]|uniref:alpha/beta hydrolase n=1 Tax=Chitinivorax sp. B TaxID=2502235 RepID=UPI0010F73A95|nr:carboxylesterase [Chitinivorax sp. B]